MKNLKRKNMGILGREVRSGKEKNLTVKHCFKKEQSRSEKQNFTTLTNSNNSHGWLFIHVRKE